MTPNRDEQGAASSVAGVGLYGPAHTPPVAMAVQRHAAELRRLAAGLDFLEAHLQRQDSAMAAMQQRMAAGMPAAVPGSPVRVTEERGGKYGQ